MKLAKPKIYRYPREIGFFDCMKLSPEDREFLSGRMAYFNYLIEQVEQTQEHLQQLTIEVKTLNDRMEDKKR